MRKVKNTSCFLDVKGKVLSADAGVGAEVEVLTKKKKRTTR